MSQKYSGGFITKSPVAPTSSAASGIWTLDQQQQAKQAGNWPSPPIFIEDLFSTYLYTGNGATQTITNNIDLSTNGGLVWMKGRSGATDHALYDTTRGATFDLVSNSSAAQTTQATGLTSFGSTGFSIGTLAKLNTSAATYVSWTFRKQPKFFDIVTYTGNGAASQTINHNLGSVPGCFIVKGTSGGTNWPVYHRSMDASPQNYYMILDGQGSKTNAVANWGNTAPTSTQFTVGGNNNGNGTTFVVYLFAHDAGGFPVSGGGSTNGISCGSFTTDGSGNATVTLGYEPQWLLLRSTTGAANWRLFDSMRGMSLSSSIELRPNTDDAESDQGILCPPNATGFKIEGLGASDTLIYIAIRRDPMKTPTVGTSVFIPLTRSGTGAAASVTTVGFPPDMAMVNIRDSGGRAFVDKLRGPKQSVTPSNTAAELTSPSTKDIKSFNQNGISFAGGSDQYSSNSNGFPYVNWYLRRAPGFFDEVCYTGTGANTTFTHNLGVVPELMIVRCRSTAGNQWAVYAAPSGNTNVIYLNQTSATSSNQYVWNNTTPTSTVFTVSIAGAVNTSAATYVAYLFATLAGVSKVGSYTGNGTTQTIDCGFTGGVRFVLIKRTDSTSNWFAYDTARGMTVLTDPYIPLNDDGANAEVATLGSVTTVSTGFALNSSILADINVSAGTYIFLAIA